MGKLFLLIAIITAIACNNSSPGTTNNQHTTDSVARKGFSWTKEDEGQFLAECVDNAKLSLGDTAAYTQCKCVLNQLQQSFPSLDSAGSILSDTTRMASLASRCK